MAIKKNESYTHGFIADGNVTIMVVAAEEVEDPTTISAALLNGATSYDATYDLTQDGWNHTPGNETSSTRRFTSNFRIERQGVQNDTLSLTYVYDPELPADEMSLDKFLVNGEHYYFFARWGVDHDEEFEVGQKVDVLYVEANRPARNQGAENEDATKTMTPSMKGIVRDDVVLVA